MEIVAIVRLAGSIEDEARALAADLGSLPYEQRLKLNAGLPAIVLQTPDAARAGAVAASLAARGHEVVRCRTEDVVASDSMIELRTFRVAADGLYAHHQAAEHRLRWTEVAALLRAAHRTSTASVTKTTQKQFSVAKTALTGGLVTHTKVTKQTLSRAVDIEAVLYVFPRAPGPPWLLRETRGRYDQMGVPPAAHTARNFELAIEQLRTRATAAAFDDRLVARKGTPPEVDVLAHLLATSLRGASPFR